MGAWMSLVRMGSSAWVCAPMRVILLMLAVGVVAPAHALPAVPAPITATTAELAQLQAGEVAVRYRGGGAETVAFVDVRATPAAVIAAAMDLAARKREVSGLKSLEVYRREPGLVGARWEAGIGPYTLAFHILYRCDMSAAWCVYDLDPSKPNDLKSTSGSYQAYTLGGGVSRLVYRAKADPTSPMPEWAQKRIAYSGAVEMVSGMKRRAEAAP